MKNPIVAALLLAVTAPMAQAVDYQTNLASFLDSQIMAWASDPVLIDAITAQNTVTAGYDTARIGEMDLTWRTEVGAGDTPTITPVLENAASDFLRMHVDASDGAIFEIFVMDAQGLNVAVSGITSDYWQGDEAKFQDSFGAGADAVHFGEIEYDESSQQYQSQISITLSDPANGVPVGAMTIGVNPDNLMQ